MAISSSSFELSLINAQFFFGNERLRAEVLIKRLPERWLEFYDDRVTSLPVPSEPPPEIPICIFRNKQNNWSCVFSSQKVVIQWAKTSKEDTIAEDDFFKEALKQAGEIAEQIGTKFYRLASVRHKYSTVENPGEALSIHFCKDNWLVAPFNRPENFQINSHKVYRFPNELDVNSWVKNQSAALAASSDQIVLVEQDINTIVDQGDNAFDLAIIESFFNLIPSQMDEILGHYYPED